MSVHKTFSLWQISNLELSELFNALSGRTSVELERHVQQQILSELKRPIFGIFQNPTAVKQYGNTIKLFFPLLGYKTYEGIAEWQLFESMLGQNWHKSLFKCAIIRDQIDELIKQGHVTKITSDGKTNNYLLSASFLESIIQRHVRRGDETKPATQLIAA